jgi:hypothetical protein
MGNLLNTVPGGKILSACRSAEPHTGIIKVPLLPAQSGQLTLHWEQIPVMLSARLLDCWWGPLFAFQTHRLGHFVYNGARMAVESVHHRSTEEFSRCRFDTHGNNFGDSEQRLAGSPAGLNVSSLHRALSTPGLTDGTDGAPLLRFKAGERGASVDQGVTWETLKLDWEHVRVNRREQDIWFWQLIIEEAYEWNPRQLQVHETETFSFNFESNRVCWQHAYSPNHW